MPATAELSAPSTDPLKKKDKVVAAVDMPGIPAGTPGRVTFVQGFDWVRYWVRFENGATRGSIDRSKLARPGEAYGEELEALKAAEAERAAAAREAKAEATASAGDGGGGDGADGIVHNGVLVPAHLLERSRNRREVLGQ